MSTKDGGPAFLHTAPKDPDYYAPGMTLRDYFAGQALAALVGLSPRNAEHLSAPEGREYAEWMAADAYDLADAMLEERAR